MTAEQASPAQITASNFTKFPDSRAAKVRNPIKNPQNKKYVTNKNVVSFSFR